MQRLIHQHDHTPVPVDRNRVFSELGRNTRTGADSLCLRLHRHSRGDTTAIKNAIERRAPDLGWIAASALAIEVCDGAADRSGGGLKAWYLGVSQ